MSDMIAEKIRQRTFVTLPPEKVYDTITTAEGWNSFFTKETTVDARPGGEIYFRWKDWGPDFYTTSAGGPVLAAVRPSLFEFQWGIKFSTKVRFELAAQYDGTIVTLTEEGYPNTPAGRAAMLDCASGWGEALTLLKFYLEYGIIYTPPRR